MEYRTLGRSGCAVSSLCVGTMTFGVETDEQGAHAQLDRFIEAGGNLVDTADVYGDGRSEEIIGRWFASRPADVTEPVVLATKGRFARGGDDSPNGAGLSARHLTRALDASLRRLGLESVDLYQVHAYDPLTPLEETLRTLEGFIQAGKIRYYGLSNFTGWQLTKAVHLARALNVAEPVTLQPQYSLLAREIEWEIVPAVLDAGLGLLPWSPLGGGWLSGKYQRDQRPTGATRLGDDPNRGMEAYDRRGTERTWNVVDAVQKVAEDRGVSMAEVALAWVTARPGRHLDHPRCAHAQPARDQPARGGPAPDRRRDRRTRRRQRPAPGRLPLRRARRGPAGPPPVRRFPDHVHDREGFRQAALAVADRPEPGRGPGQRGRRVHDHRTGRPWRWWMRRLRCNRVRLRWRRR